VHGYVATTTGKTTDARPHQRDGGMMPRLRMKALRMSSSKWPCQWTCAPVDSAGSQPACIGRPTDGVVTSHTATPWRQLGDAQPDRPSGEPLPLISSLVMRNHVKHGLSGEARSRRIRRGAGCGEITENHYRPELPGLFRTSSGVAGLPMASSTPQCPPAVIPLGKPDLPAQ